MWPATPEGALLASEVRDCTRVSAETKVRVTREIIDHETTHGTCTQTFTKKVRKLLR
jgi:hypothetical protein